MKGGGTSFDSHFILINVNLYGITKVFFYEGLFAYLPLKSSVLSRLIHSSW